MPVVPGGPTNRVCIARKATSGIRYQGGRSVTAKVCNSSVELEGEGVVWIRCPTNAVKHRDPEDRVEDAILGLAKEIVSVQIVPLKYLGRIRRRDQQE